MLPKKQPPLVRAETICCVIAAVLAAFCLMDHPAGCWPPFWHCSSPPM